MSRFSNILKGNRAIKRVVCPIVNGSVDAKTDSTEALTQFVCGTRVLSVAEQETVYEKALERTKRLGGEEREDSALYNLSLQLYTIAASYVDPDSDPARPALYFGDTIDDAAEKIAKSELLSRDVLAYLAEVHEVWQDQLNPQSSPKQSEMLQYIEAIAKDASYFLLLGPAHRITLANTICNLYLNLLKDSLPSGHVSNESSTSAPSVKAKRPSPSKRRNGISKRSRR
jgi:hypothetical protein